MTSFNSPMFLFLFLPAFLALYYFSGKRWRILTGILGSLIFYASANLTYVPVLIALLLANYLVGNGIAAGRGRTQGSVWLWAGILTDIGVLVFFKLSRGVPYPLGLSYVSFQLLSYLIDVYKATIAAETDIIRFSFYVLLFPKILVGPIVRYRSLKEHVGEPRIMPEAAADGLRRFVRGLAKKVLIADFLSKIVNPIFALDNPTISPGLAWLVLVAFALQLFFDFSGYTDMAIGLGKMMGLPFIENFNFPYLSRNISEFWRRWHISLSTWFRDYVFFPLERRRLNWIGQPLNVLIVFALTGLWHGISWNYLVWGLIHGSAIAFENTGIGRRLRSTWAPVQHIYALGVLLFSWVFFRSPNLLFAVRFLSRLSGRVSGITPLAFQVTAPLPIIDPSVVLALVLAILLCLPVGQWFARWLAGITSGRPHLQLTFQISYDLQILLLFAASVAASVAGTYTPGIYDKF